MVFSSVPFLAIFLPAFLGIYFLLPRTWRNYWLLFASAVFYARGAPDFILVVLGSIVLDYFLVVRMSDTTGRQRKLLAGIAVAANIGLLGWFKYANFAVDNLGGILRDLGIGTSGWVEVALPIGISFFTFQKITYVVDVYRSTSKVQRSLLSYAVYVLMFPQLIAGPIVRYHEIEKQIGGRKESMQRFTSGFFRFSIGLARKVLIADTLAGLADQGFSADPACLSTGEAWLGLLAYAFQIYHDFAGYSDMAIGLGRMTGFELPENFMNPYRSRSITEFWRRWHISLSRFMRDYLYIPLGGNRRGQARTYVNLVVVFLLSGLWHGAAWNFVIWGAWHGLFLILDRLFLRSWLDRIPAFFSTLSVFLIVMAGWIVFRADNLALGAGYFRALAGMTQGCGMISIGRDHLVLITLASAWAFLSVIPSLERWQERMLATGQPGRPLLATTLAVILFILSTAYLMGSEVHPFIYFRF